MEKANPVLACSQVFRSARPFKGLCLADEARPHGIQLDVGEHAIRGGILYRARIEAILPKMAAPALRGIRVLPVRVPERLRQRFGMFGDGQQVHVIRHQAIAEDRQVLPVRVLFQQRQVNIADWSDVKIAWRLMPRCVMWCGMPLLLGPCVPCKVEVDFGWMRSHEIMETWGASLGFFHEL